MKRHNLYLSTIASDAAPLARTYGLGLELAQFCTASRLDDTRADTDREIGQAMSGIARCTLHGPFNELFPCAIDPKIRGLAAFRYRQAIAAAQQYGANTLILHSGYNPNIYFDCWFEEQSILFWKEFLREVPEGITICLENVLETQPEPLLHVLEGVDDPRLRICLDVGHANAYPPRSVFDWLSVLAPYISHFHLHNNIGDFDAHQPLDQGSIPMTTFLQQAQTLCPQATYTLEVLEAASSLRWLEKHSLLEESL